MANDRSKIFKARRVALVLGANGQDGSYLVEHLLRRGWLVCGLGRQTAARWVAEGPDYCYQSTDLSDLTRLETILHEVQPDVIFHFAAVHGSSGFCYENRWRDVHAVNTVSAHVILEYLRCVSPQSSLVYASSSKVFGPELPETVDESSKRVSKCIYSTTKNAATDLIDYYRARHGVNASVVWTFNHESPRRGEYYFIPQIVDILAKSIIDQNYVGEIGTLGFWADWGDADEYMDIVSDLGTEAHSKDFVLATGTTLWAHDFAATLFAQYGRSQKHNLKEKFSVTGDRPTQWHANISALQATTKRSPTRTIFDVVATILRQRYPYAWEHVESHQPNIT
jgi:GDPmannose 4,6-dehydratase